MIIPLLRRRYFFFLFKQCIPVSKDERLYGISLSNYLHDMTRMI